MKLLFCGNYREQTGYGTAARHYLKALDMAGVNAVARPLFLGGPRCAVDKRIEELENQPAGGCTHSLQLTLPHLMEFAGGLHNIGLYFSESSNFRATNWAQKLNLLDEVWVCNQQMVGCAADSFVRHSPKVVPIPCDISEYQRAYQPLEELDDGGAIFKFYFIGELNKRKNLSTLLKAFHLEFQLHEQVALIIKTSKPGASPATCQQEVDRLIAVVKNGLKLYAQPEFYHKEIVFTQPFTHEQIMRLHTSCDCFISTSYGEAFCLPCFDSMAIGKGVIAPESTGFDEYLNHWNAWLLETRSEPVFGQVDTFHELNTSNENWYAINISDLRKAMRSAYEDKKLLDEKSEAGMEKAYDFTYEKIGEQMRELLSAK